MALQDQTNAQIVGFKRCDDVCDHTFEVWLTWSHTLLYLRQTWLWVMSPPTSSLKLTPSLTQPFPKPVNLTQGRVGTWPATVQGPFIRPILWNCICCKLF